MRRAAPDFAISSKKSRGAWEKNERGGGEAAEAARGALLGDLLEEVEVRVEEEREPRREVVDVEPPLERPLDVGEAVHERERQLLRRVRAGLADVVARDRDRMPFRQLLRAELDHVGD